MILSEGDRRSINTSARNRERAKRERTRAPGSEMLARELFAIQKLYPDYDAILDACPGRDLKWAKRKARQYGVVKPKHVWTTKECALLKEIWLTATHAELLEAFPFAKMGMIKNKARHLKLPFREAPFVLSGDPLIDAIRVRCRDLRYSMPDLDKLVGGGSYWAHNAWDRRGAGKGIKRDLARCIKAIEVLEGDIAVTWSPLD